MVSKLEELGDVKGKRYDIPILVAGEPIELVRCKTVDIEVPATAAIA